MKLLITWNSTRTKLWIHILHPSLQKLSRSMAARSLGREKILSLISRFFFFSVSNTHTKWRTNTVSCACPSTWWFSWFSLLFWLLLLVAIVISVLLYFLKLFFLLSTLDTGYIYCFSLLLLLIRHRIISVGWGRASSRQRRTRDSLVVVGGGKWVEKCIFTQRWAAEWNPITKDWV